MAKIYFVCGFIGSGKTTYSKQLEKAQGAFRFNLDEWMIPLFGEHMDREVFDKRKKTLTDLFKGSALRLLELDVPVIFDFGFWKKQDRIQIKTWANENNLTYEMVYLDVDFDICKERATKRNRERGQDAYEMTPEMLDLFWSWFEVPTEDEGVTFYR
ncbi:ATP-binding protein [Vibrio hannami]|uniref:AAA family ATPase n=1 Tax=Vibrio hannami TaxID=2717094 RepID=UPI00240F5CA3|nr:ATP-binding protein [Vibrio hannami]MDG3085680.1 ATP-binding protein [Vibrio hannami]